MGFNPEEQYHARELEAMFDRWHAADEVWDKQLDIEIHEMYAKKMRQLEEEGNGINWSVPFFSPSSANSCKRELYEKVMRSKKDKGSRSSVQGRWTRMGTAWGDVAQRDLLFIEKHWEKKFGTPPPFIPQKDEAGFPMWEEFASKFHKVNYRGHEFAFNGQPDGILICTETGERIGIEFKTKSTTAAQTSHYSMRQPKDDHIRQCVAYSIMYGVDRYLIVYNNLSKKSWIMSDEDYLKNPDLRVFEIEITDDDRREVLDHLADVLDAAGRKRAPMIDLDKWTFNNYKTVIATALKPMELELLKDQIKSVMRSALPQWKKNSYFEAWQQIVEIRKGAGLDV